MPSSLSLPADNVYELIDEVDSPVAINNEIKTVSNF